MVKIHVVKMCIKIKSMISLQLQGEKNTFPVTKKQNKQKNPLNVTLKLIIS